jgi:hypothetical protein
MNMMQKTGAYKHNIGDVFLEDDGDIHEIIGFNYKENRYKVKVLSEYSDGTKIEVETDFASDRNLDKFKKFSSMKELKKMSNYKSVNYKIYYFDPLTDGDTKVQKAENITITMTSSRQLFRMLNNMRKRNPQRRVTMVAIVDSSGKFLTHVRLLPQEINRQKFLTGKKERLLAHAKYTCGYELKIGF